AKWWRLFKCYGIPTFVCFDNDNKDDKQNTKRTEALKAIGIDDGQIENLLSAEDWNINSNFCVFGADFEVTMRNSFALYEEIETEEKDRLGPSKPIVAKAVSERLFKEELNEEDEGWQRFSELKDFIVALK